jgi:hypothetical protein
MLEVSSNCWGKKNLGEQYCTVLSAMQRSGIICHASISILCSDHLLSNSRNGNSLNLITLLEDFKGLSHEMDLAFDDMHG